jgi:hypothetical protein
MRNVLIALAAVVTLVSQVSGQAPAAPKVQITFEPGGMVSLSASGATAREILAEWKRMGGTQFDGIDRITSTPLTLQFDHRPETEVMASLLRGAAGYVIGPLRDAPSSSSLTVVYVLATSTPTSTGYSAPAPYTPPPQQASTPGSPDSEIPPVGPGRAGQPGQPPPDAQPSPTPRPSGVAVPIVPAVVVVPVTTPPPTGPGRGGGGGGGR